MKQLIFLFSLFVICSQAFSQDKTISKSLSSGAVYFQYSFTAADTLTSNQDTIDLVLKYTGGYVKKITLKTRFDVISGADTTVNVSLFGKEFSDDATYVQIIAAATSDQVLANNTIQVLSSDWTETIASYNSTIPATDIPFTNPTAGTADTLEVPSIAVVNAAQTVTPLDKTYRYYRIRYIYNGPDISAGSGILLDDFEIKMYP